MNTLETLYYTHAHWLYTQVLDRRTAVFPKLLSLNGRLELALSQLSRDDPKDGTFPHVTYDEEVEEALGSVERHVDEDSEEGDIDESDDDN